MFIGTIAYQTTWRVNPRRVRTTSHSALFLSKGQKENVHKCLAIRVKFLRGAITIVMDSDKKQYVGDTGVKEGQPLNAKMRYTSTSHGC